MPSPFSANIGLIDRFKRDIEYFGLVTVGRCWNGVEQLKSSGSVFTMFVEVENDHEFQRLMSTNQNTVLFVDFNATWCGPCQAIGPHFKKVAEAFPANTFASVDIDKCKATAQSFGITAIPTFIVFIRSQKLDTLGAANPTSLHNWVEKWSKNSVMMESDVPGQYDLTGFIDATRSEVLNDEDPTAFRSLVNPNAPDVPLASDCDEQLIMNIVFSQAVKVHSIQIDGPGEEAPKHVKLFVNVPVTFDFDRAQSTEPVQALDLSESSLQALRFVKFQNVQNLQIFVENNKGGDDKTIINKLKIYGTPVNGVTNMNSFKRVSGKAGRTH
uniref:Thioredoxin n=1 Tax=Panagrellus redivivus TaxID=6233 RepID=A0A7E4VH30_PANRE